MITILEKFNLIGFRFFNDLAGHNAGLDWIFVFVSDQMGYVLIFLLFVLFWKREDFKQVVLVSLGSAIVARFVLVSLIRYFTYSPRPFLILENVNKLVSNENASSFPSGHASFYFALAMGVYFYNKKTGLIFLCLAGLMGVARIFVGVHWPLDILAGAGLGIATAYVMERFVSPRVPTLF